MKENIIKVQQTIKEISQELHPRNKNGENEKRIRKKCFGCLDQFICYQSKNYDYCRDCELNGSRYLNKDSPCSECDGSGIIKVKNQPPRSCKLCYLAQQEEKNIFAK